MEPERRSHLLTLSANAEDVASGLITFRGALPLDAVRITAIIQQLFALSTVLQELDVAHRDPRHAPSLYRIRDDLSLVCASLERTLHAGLAMFGRTGLGRSYEMVWDDLEHRMGQEENCGLLQRLECYEDYLVALRCIITDHPPAEDVRRLRAAVQELLELQEVPQNIVRRSSRRRRRISRPQPLETPIPPATTYTDAQNYDAYAPRRAPPAAPEAPSYPAQTSYSGPAPPIHWALDVFDGSYPGHPFRGSSKSLEPSTCHGNIDMLALDSLAAHGFVRVLEQSFDNETLWVRLYWRPPDHRGRILVMTQHDRRPQHYCTAIQNLKIIRDGSCLQLCRLGRATTTYVLWARLNFGLYERLVLFYNTFVAMKRQEPRPLAHPNLIETCGLLDDTNGEFELFGGCILSGTLQHSLRLFKDRGSGVVRLEACALRGPMQDVPLWTAFVTQYKHDPDHMSLDGRQTVSLAALRHKPYVFLGQYEPPRNRNGEYVLQFISNRDARHFMETWAGLHRMASMRFN